MFTREVTDLASLWIGGIASGAFATEERVNVSSGIVTVAGRIDWHNMEVVDCVH